MAKLLGAHVSAAGGPWMAVRNALALGPNARSLAFFIRPHRTWKPSAPFDPQAIAKFHQELTHPAKGGGDAIALENVVVHGSYLLNLGSQDATLRRKSVDLMLEEVSKCQQLGIQLYVFHPGASKDRESKPKAKRAKTSATSAEEEEKKEAATQSKQQRRQQSIERLGESMAQVLRATQDVVLVVENMAGQGTLLGVTFEELRAVLDAAWAASTSGSPTEQTPAAARKRLGVCIDTCHAFASGWVMDSDEQCDQMMAHFNECMGDAWPDVLKVVHVNDSQTACGSRVDRHANIGLGQIGLCAFEWIMNTPHFEHVPMILETPRTKKQRKAQQRRRRNANQESAENETEESSNSSQSNKKRERKTNTETVSVTRPSATEELETLTQMIRKA